MLKYGREAILFLIILLLSICTGNALGQNATEELEPQPPLEISGQNVTSAPLETETPPPEVNRPVEWVWGEVVSVDKAASQILVKYVDYETDEEKQTTFVVTPQTSLENIKSIEEIGIGDSITIDYSVDKDNRNLAQNISVEKKETLESEESEAQETENNSTNSVNP